MTTTIERAWLVALWLAGGVHTAQACGVCIEDKMAATYDHAVLQQATTEGKVVVYCDVEGPATALPKLKDAAIRTPGVAGDSVRVSSDPQALSFMLDPRTHTVDEAVAAIAKAATGPWRIQVIRVLPLRPS
ncbi:MAG: hypothetical protein QM742_09130 [Aquabacterium sp.]